MLTRIEISGFKSFTDFSVDLAPLTLIAGANGTGKSNLFDALQLLRALVASSSSINPAGAVRGGLLEAFTKYAKGQNASRMSFAVELSLINSQLPNSGLSITHDHFRYEIDITIHKTKTGGYYPALAREMLRPVISESLVKKDQTWFLINREMVTPTQELTFHPLFEHGDFFIGPTVLGQTNDEADIHQIAVRETLLGVLPISLNDRNNFSNYNQATSNYENAIVLRALLATAQSDIELNALRNRVQQIATDITQIDVYADDFQRISVTATDQHGKKFLAENLSEGTRRIIALSALYLRSVGVKTLLLEEPENGLDPRVMKELLSLLRDYSTNPHGTKKLSRQVICTTHSPTLIRLALQQQDQPNNLLVLFAQRASTNVQVKGERQMIRTTRLLPVVTDTASEEMDSLEHYTLLQVMNYFDKSLVQGITEKFSADA